jgi:hypothetical protein
MPQRKHRPIPQFSEEQIEDFWAKVDQQGSDDCWSWTERTFTTHTNRAGERYGQFASFIASRVAYFVATGIDPGEFIVRHRCDDPLCCNPAHLVLGTYTDNGRDRRERGRINKAVRCWPESSRNNGQVPAKAASHIPHVTFRAMPILNENGTRNFYKKVQKRGPDECWLWLGGFGVNGYGQFSVAYRNWQAPRIAFFLHNGMDPGELHVCHSCDNPACCNPRHLSLGTPLENANQRSERHPVRQDGEFSNRAILTWESVDQIRAKYATGQYTQRELGDEYGVSRSCIRSVTRHENWHQLPHTTPGNSDPVTHVSNCDPSR